MQLNKMFLAFVIVYTYISMTNVFCSAKFRISKFNMCPPEDSKFLSLVNLSLGQCVDECSRRRHCYSVGYKRLYNLCELYIPYQMASVSRGRCVIVNKEDIQGQVESNSIFIMYTFATVSNWSCFYLFKCTCHYLLSFF